MNTMPISKRCKTSSRHILHLNVGTGDGDDDNKNAKVESQNSSLLRKTVFFFALVATLLVFVFGHTKSEKGSMGDQMSSVGPETVTEKKNGGGSSSSSSSGGGSHSNAYELYPFLVDSRAVTKAKHKASESEFEAVLSTPTLPEFPVIPRLEGCKVAYKPSNPPRTEKSEWRKLFWIPSTSGAGSANPTQQGDIVKYIIEGLFSGEDGANVRSSYYHPVKNFHLSIRNKLNHCIGVSESVGCSCGHPTVSASPDKFKDNFRREAIVPIRNPATVIPATFTYKNIAYHNGDKQCEEDGWRGHRDAWVHGPGEWINLIKYWRGKASDSDSYFTGVYVPFEDLVTTDMAKGVATVKKLAETIRGENASGSNDEYFETSTSEADYECIWYRTAKLEWERQQSIVGDYIPAFTPTLKHRFVKGLNDYADEVENDPYRGETDAVLVSLLRRYANQIDKYLRVEEPSETAEAKEEEPSDQAEAKKEDPDASSDSSSSTVSPQN